MQLTRFSLLLGATVLLSGCQLINEQFKQPENKPVKVVSQHSPEYSKYTRNTPVAKSTKKAPTTTVKSGTRRINTTECRDSDDWYLDGFRVGKSFRSQKNEQFQQRVNYCRYTAATLPASFKANWERGFAVGQR